MRALRTGLFCALLAWPDGALAWTEAQPTDTELQVAVDGSGGMMGVYRVTIHIDAGRFHGFDLDGLPDQFVADPFGTRAHDADGREIGVRTERWRSGRLHVELDSPRGARRGRVVFEIAFRAVATVSEEDGRAAIEVSTPPWDHGMDRTVVSLEVEAPRDEVEVVDADLYDDLRVEEDAGRTRVVALRHRLPRWTPMVLRVTLPRARMQAVLGPAAAAPRRPRVAARRTPDSPPQRRAPWLPWAVAFAPALLAAWKALETRRSARRAGCLAAPAIAPRVSAGARGFLLLALCVAAGAAQTKGSAAAATAFLLLAGLVGAMRFVRPPERPPGPGRWTRAEPEELGETVRRARSRRRTLRLLDPTTLPGLATSAVLVGGAAVALRDPAAPDVETLLALAAAVAAVLLVPLLTAHGTTIPPPRVARESARLLRLLRPVESSVEKAGGGGVGPIARLPDGSDVPDRVRLRIGPTLAPAGLRCIEVGIEHLGEQAWPAGLVRVAPGSPAEEVVLRARPRLPILRAPDGTETVGVIDTGPGGRRRFLRALGRLVRALRDAVPDDTSDVDSAGAQGPRDVAASG